MKKTAQVLVPRWVMRGVHGRVILAEELLAFPLRKVPQNHQRVSRILDWLRGHVAECTPRRVL